MALRWACAVCAVQGLVPLALPARLRARGSPLRLIYGDVEERDINLSNEALTLSGEGSSFADSTVADLAFDYNFPVAYIADALVGLGAAPPIRALDKISSLIDGEKAFALLEALTSFDPNDLEDSYVGHTLHRTAALFGVPVHVLFGRCVEKDYALPHGLETELRQEHFADLADEFGFDDTEDFDAAQLATEFLRAAPKDFPEFEKYVTEYSEREGSGPFDSTQDYH
ncbi:hypothetical protein M885DRAFT_504506 [Pelagophyceae sp. CCMP2097]|nr:hypothetical protein M885DRAFT_504506 [Pelagophyceae sp. CCMP2097]